MTEVISGSFQSVNSVGLRHVEKAAILHSEASQISLMETPFNPFLAKRRVAILKMRPFSQIPILPVFLTCRHY